MEAVFVGVQVEKHHQGIGDGRLVLIYQEGGGAAVPKPDRGLPVDPPGFVAAAVLPQGTAAGHVLVEGAAAGEFTQGDASGAVKADHSRRGVYHQAGAFSGGCGEGEKPQGIGAAQLRGAQAADAPLGTVGLPCEDKPGPAGEGAEFFVVPEHRQIPRPVPQGQHEGRQEAAVLHAQLDGGPLEAEAANLRVPAEYSKAAEQVLAVQPGP